MTKLWFQSFTDPDSDRAYFDRLVDFVRSAVTPDAVVHVYGIRPGDHDLHPVTRVQWESAWAILPQTPLIYNTLH